MLIWFLKLRISRLYLVIFNLHVGLYCAPIAVLCCFSSFFSIKSHVSNYFNKLPRK